MLAFHGIRPQTQMSQSDLPERRMPSHARIREVSASAGSKVTPVKHCNFIIRAQIFCDLSCSSGEILKFSAILLQILAPALRIRPATPLRRCSGTGLSTLQAGNVQRRPQCGRGSGVVHTRTPNYSAYIVKSFLSVQIYAQNSAKIKFCEK